MGYKYTVTLKHDDRHVSIGTDDLNELVRVGWFRAFLGLEIIENEDYDDEPVEREEIDPSTVPRPSRAEMQEMPQQEQQEGYPQQGYPDQGGANYGN